MSVSSWLRLRVLEVLDIVVVDEDVLRIGRVLSSLSELGLDGFCFGSGLLGCSLSRSVLTERELGNEEEGTKGQFASGTTRAEKRRDVKAHVQGLPVLLEVLLVLGSELREREG